MKLNECSKKWWRIFNIRHLNKVIRCLNITRYLDSMQVSEMFMVFYWGTKSAYVLHFGGFVIFPRQLSQSLGAVRVEAYTLVILGWGGKELFYSI